MYPEMSNKEPSKKQTPKKEVTYLENSVDHNNAQTQCCCCGKHLPEPKSQHQESHLKPQKRVPLLPQYPKNSYQHGQHLFHKKPAMQQAPDLPRYPQPVKMIRKQDQDQDQKAQKADKDKAVKRKAQDKPQQNMQLPRNSTQEQLRRYRLERFYAECENPLETKEQTPSWPQHPYTSYQVERDENQGEVPMEQDWSALRKEPTDLPRFPVATYRGRKPFDGNVQVSTSRILPPQGQPQEQSRSSNDWSLTPENPRSSSTLYADASDKYDSVFEIP